MQCRLHIVAEESTAFSYGRSKLKPALFFLTVSNDPKFLNAVSLHH